MYVKGSPVEIQTPTRCNVIGQGVAAPLPLIAQQYSSVIFILLRFHPRKEKICPRLNNITSFLFLLVLRKSEIA
jgi:hypothetical protein